MGRLFVVLFAVCFAVAVSADDFSPTELVKPPTGGWKTNGGTLFNQRYSPLDQINTSNVHELKGVWRVRLNGSGVGPPYSGEAQPIVYEGVLYIVTGADDVFAIDVATGEFLWTYEADLDQSISTVCCGWTSRGVGISDDHIYLGRLDGKLEALDRESGELVWSTQVEHWQNGYTITSAPLFYDGMVITGLAGAEYATRGRVAAYDAETGELIWTFYTVPAPGEYGHDTWPEDSDIWKFGGGTVWQTPAVDPDLGLVYFSTGNPGPDFDGSMREGNNLFTASMVALDVKTGEYRWHFQQVHHDIWDYDAPSPVVLFDIEIEGQTRKAIAEVGKTGWVYILDRTNGAPLIGIKETPVPQEPRQLTSATQPIPVGEPVVPQSIDYPVSGFRLVNEGRIFTPFWETPVLIRPSYRGAVNWPPSSYDPRSGLLFVCAIDSIGVFSRGETDEPTQAGKFFSGGAFENANFPATGVFAAMDMRTNKARWRQRWPEMCYSGSVATAGGLVFTGMSDGRFIALNALTGDELWSFQTDAGVNAPASVFEQGGKQFVAVYSAGNVSANSPPGDSVWLFSLDGTLRPVAPPLEAEPTNLSMEGADASSGREIYGRLCASCHGAAGGGGHGGGPPLLSQMDASYVAAMVMNGRENMPSFEPQLDADEIRDVVFYVREELQNDD